jgi:hypothetical protein
MQIILHHYIATVLVAWAAAVLPILLFNHNAHLNDDILNREEGLGQQVVTTVHEHKGRVAPSPSHSMATTAQS